MELGERSGFSLLVYFITSSDLETIDLLRAISKKKKEEVPINLLTTY